MEKKLRERLNALMDGRTRRAIALVLAAVVTFSTTYSLVLPAISLEKDTAETMNGVSMGANGQKEEVSASSERGIGSG